MRSNRALLGGPAQYPSAKSKSPNPTLPTNAPATVQPPPALPPQSTNESKHVNTTPTPPVYFTKIRFFLLAAGFVCFTFIVAGIFALSLNSPKKYHMGQQPHVVRTVDANFTELEIYWEFTVASGLQVWQEIPSSGAIPDIIAPKGSVQKFEVSCTTTDGITLTKGVGFDALAFDARLRYLPINGDIKLLFYANNIELFQAKCTLFVKINPQF